MDAFVASSVDPEPVGNPWTYSSSPFGSGVGGSGRPFHTPLGSDEEPTGPQGGCQLTGGSPGQRHRQLIEGPGSVPPTMAWTEPPHGRAHLPRITRVENCLGIDQAPGGHPGRVSGSVCQRTQPCPFGDGTPFGLQYPGIPTEEEAFAVTDQLARLGLDAAVVRPV